VIRLAGGYLKLTWIDMLKFRLIKNDFKPFLQGVSRLATSAGRRTVQLSMATKFLEITKSTSTSPNQRPLKWPPLSAKYAKCVGRRNATLKETGALFDSIKIGNNRDKYCEVSTDIEYAWAQFFGYRQNNLPARPYFPVEFTGSSYRPTFSADRQIWIEARRAIQRVTRGALPMTDGAQFTRFTPETHPLASPVT
jgi:phage gpG-like protein